jgi:hypothetical protein
MSRRGSLFVGLVLLCGALTFAGYRNLLPITSNQSKFSTPAPATRSISPQAGGSSSGSKSGLSGLQVFELGLNAANVLVGILGIWMTMRGMRAERRSMALKREE